MATSTPLLAITHVKLAKQALCESFRQNKSDLDDKHRLQPIRDKLATLKALSMLKQHPHIQGHLNSIGVSVAQGHLYLDGRLPSFFMKQLAQEALRGLQGVVIENRIEVDTTDSSIRADVKLSQTN